MPAVFAAPLQRIGDLQGSPSPALLALTSSGNLILHELVVTDQTSIDALSSRLAGKCVDILINNAGILGPEHQAREDMDVDGWLHTFAVNSIAPLMVSQALLENLKLSTNARLITITSQMGSLNRQSMGMYAYRSSKAAANKVTQVLSLELREHDATVCAVHPGWVKTDMGGSAS